MKCPIDAATLVMSERSGVEIDYCPECRGVWLDRGELDKILDRAASEFAASAPVQHAPVQQVAQQPQYRQQPQYGERDGSRQKKRKENWLEDLFG